MVVIPLSPECLQQVHGQNMGVDWGDWSHHGQHRGWRLEGVDLLPPGSLPQLPALTLGQ